MNPTHSMLEELFLGSPLKESPKLIPGLLLATLLVIVAIIVANSFNSLLGYKGLVSYILVAILMGIMVRNLVGVPQICQPGLNFSLRKLLRLGIILLGIRLSISDIAVIGIWGLPIVIGCIIIGLSATLLLNRILNLPARLGILIAIGTSICGASAIVASSATIEATDEEVAYAIANITIFGIAAMLFYPYLANVIFAGDIIRTGLFIGTSIHETAQVAAAGLIFDQSFDVSSSPTAADVAVIAKLVRNLMMVIVIPTMAFVYIRKTAQIRRSSTLRGPRILDLIPMFIFGFLLMSIIRSLGDTHLTNHGLALGIWTPESWERAIAQVKDISGYVLASAMASVGLGTSFRSIRNIGPKPLAVGLAASVAVGITSVTLIVTLGHLVHF